MNAKHREQLAPAESGGAAYAEPSDTGTTVRIAPIKEGDRTVGHRPGSDDTEPTLWDRGPVKEAVESGALDGSTIVKGRGGKNPHYGFDEQVPADAVLGKVDSWEYEDGVGPVGKTQLADEGIADRIELDLLDVSGDWLRRLGEYDADRGGNPVDEVIGLPRVTVVERGASNASIDIESETAEALGYNPDVHEGEGEQHADAPAPPDAWVDFYDQLTDGTAVSISGAYYSEGDYWICVHPEGDAYPDADPSLGSSIGELGPFPAGRSEGAIALPLEEPIEQSQTLHVALHHDDGGEKGDHVVIDDRFAMSGAVVRVADATAEYLAETDAQPQVDEPAESGTDGDNETPDMGSNNDNELREQLAEVRTERNDLDEKVDSLEDETENLEEQLAEKKSTIEDKDDKIDNLEEEYGPIKELLAEIAVGDSPLEPEKVAEMHSGQELVEMLAEDVEDADDKSYSDMVKEQLGAPLDPRGKGEEENGPVDDYDDEEVEQLAGNVLSARDIQRINGEDISRREYLKREHDVDPAQYGSESSLRTAIDSANGGAN